MRRVDINSDLGESFGAYTIGSDEAVMQYATSVNIACGFHAGDPVVMEKTVALARAAGVGVGAHPGYPDLQGFGRRRLAMSPSEARAAVIYQIGALQGFLNAAGLTLQHVKLHGALYNAAATDDALARAVCLGVRDAAPGAILLGLSGSAMLRAAEQAGLRAAGEVFADRAYNDDGTLVSRSLPGAVLHDAGFAIARAVRMVKEGVVESVNGKPTPVRADSICVHGDNANALEFVRRLRRALEAEGVVVAPLGAPN